MTNPFAIQDEARARHLRRLQEAEASHSLRSARGQRGRRPPRRWPFAIGRLFGAGTGAAERAEGTAALSE